MHRFRIGVLTSGGDCPGLNAVIRATVASAHTLGWEVLGFIDGYEGLLSPVNYKILTLENTEGIMPIGGTIIGTTNKGRFVAKSGHGEKALIPQPIIDEAKKTLQDLGVRALICIGGDGSLTTADQLFENGVPVRRRAEDDRQRYFRHGDDLRFRLGGAMRGRRARPPAHHGGQPQARHGARGHGPLRGLDRAARRPGRRRRCRS